MSQTAPGDARQEWPYDEGRNDSHGAGQGLPGSGEGDMGGAAGPEYDGQWQGDQGYQGQVYPGNGNDDWYYQQPGYDAQGYQNQSYDVQGPGGQGYGGQGYGGQAYQPTWQYQGHANQPPWQHTAQEYQQQEYGRDGYGVPASPVSQEQEQPGRRVRHRRRRRRSDHGTPGERKVHFRRLRRFARRPTVRVIGALIGVFLIWVMFSAGQAAFKNNGQGFTANLAEWARDHYLGPVVTFGEWLSYQPPKVGGKPSFSYAVPKNEQVSPAKGKHKGGFVPDIPPPVKTLAAGPALPGEGQWRVVEKVKGEPAILVTFLRDGGQYTSYSNGIASIDQRLVRFSLRPGTEDPGSPAGNASWGVPDYIPPGQRTGLLATFNGGFKLDSAGGGFYLNGIYHGSLVNGAASIVYYKNGTIKIGEWGRDFTMNSSIEGVRQNLKLLVDHGKVAANANLDVETNWGATLGGGYWVWRSGIGITKDGRIIFVYGQALDAQDLAQLLKQAGVVEGMQMDINPEWMKFDYYEADGNPADPTPVPLLPTQQASPYSYYTPSTRDFTAVYAR